MKKTGIIAAALVVFCGVAQAQQAPTVVAPGDTGLISFPVAAGPLSLPVENVSITVTVDPALDFKVQPASLGPVTIVPGTTHEFLINYTIGPNATTPGTYTVTLHYSSTNPDVYPDPDDPPGDTSVIFGGGAVRSADEPFAVAVLKSLIGKPVNFPSSRSNTFLPQGEESSRGGQAQLPHLRGERARSRGVALPLVPHSALALAATQAPTPRARGSAAVLRQPPTPAAPHARKLPGHARRVARRWPFSSVRFVTARAPQARPHLGPRRPAGSAAALFSRSAAETEEVFHSPPPPNAGRAFGAARVVPINDLSTLSTVSTARLRRGGGLLG